MTETATAATHHPIKIGPGRVVMVVGPSGAGKDTLMALAREACAGDRDIVFPRRVVTRESSAFENNDWVSPEAFQRALVRGEFVMQWQAHGLQYGLPRLIDDEIRQGHTVVLNVSRTVVGAMREIYERVTVAEVTAAPEILAARLAARGRASDGPLEARLQRDVGVVVEPDVTIINIGAAETHARELLMAIKGN